MSPCGTSTQDGCRSEVAVQTQGRIETPASAGVTRFEQEYTGRGPKDIRTYLAGDLLVVRLHGVLTAAEQHLVQSPPPSVHHDVSTMTGEEVVVFALAESSVTRGSRIGGA